MLRAFLFDMDGVVIHSTQLHTDCWRIYLQRLGVSADGISDKMLGKRNDELVPLLFPYPLTAEEINRHGAAKEALYRELLGPRVGESLVTGLVPFLRRWIALPMALATNAEPENVEFVLSGTGLRDRFHAVVDGTQVSRPKPAPDVFLRAADLLGVDVRDCVVFEDSPGGVEAGRRAGAHVVGLTTTVARLEEAHLEVRDFEDPGLEPWLRSLENGG